MNADAKRRAFTKWLIFSFEMSVFCILCACRDQGKIETENLIDVVLKYRGASDRDKSARAQDIARAACTVKDICDARDKCFGAATGYVRATGLTQEAKARLAKVESGELAKDGPEALALPKMIDDAESTLGASRKEMTECEGALDTIARAHHASP